MFLKWSIYKIESIIYSSILVEKYILNQKIGLFQKNYLLLHPCKKGSSYETQSGI